jgi:hypothetical protein
MLFFRTISLVAALAFATLSSAVPVEGAGLALSGDVIARDVSELALPVKRAAGIPDLYNSCHQKVQEIIVKIEVAVETGNHGVIVGCLNEIIAEINILIEGVRVYGRIELDISVVVFCSIIYGLIQIIVDVLHLVVNISVEITACINVIGGLLGILLQVTVSVVVGLNVTILASILQPLGGILSILGFIHIFVGIGISL